MTGTVPVFDTARLLSRLQTKQNLTKNEVAPVVVLLSFFFWGGGGGGGGPFFFLRPFLRQYLYLKMTVPLLLTWLKFSDIHVGFLKLVAVTRSVCCSRSGVFFLALCKARAFANRFAFLPRNIWFDICSTVFGCQSPCDKTGDKIRENERRE